MAEKKKKMTAQEKAELEAAMDKFVYDHVVAFNKKVAKDSAAAGYCPVCVLKKLTVGLVQCFGTLLDGYAEEAEKRAEEAKAAKKSLAKQIPAPEKREPAKKVSK